MLTIKISINSCYKLHISGSKPFQYGDSKFPILERELYEERLLGVLKKQSNAKQNLQTFLLLDIATIKILSLFPSGVFWDIMYS